MTHHKNSKIKQHKQKVACCFHHPCLDGNISAWLFAKAMRKKNIDLSFIGQTHGKNANENIPWDHYKNADVIYFLDYAPSRSVIKKLLNDGKTIHVWDHHGTTKDNLQSIQHPNFHLVFDNKESGASLTWKQLHPNRPIPDIVQMVRKMDLDLLKTDQDFEVASYIDHFEINKTTKHFSLWDKIAKTGIYELARLGRPLRNQDLKQIKQQIKENLKWITIYDPQSKQKLRVPLLEADIMDYGRELTREMLKQSGDVGIAVIMKKEKDYIRLNIRSNGRYDAGKIAKTLSNQSGMNGGGRTGAAIARTHKKGFKQLKP